MVKIDSTMTPNQQTFIQVLMQNGIVSDPMMKQLSKKVFAAEDEENQDVDFQVTKVNRSVQDLGMGIKQATCELSGEKYWLFTSTVIPELENFNYENKPFLEFTKVELKFLNKIFEEVISSNEGNISSINCINLVEEIEEPFTHSQADEFIKKMIQRMWLSLKDGQIYLGVRSIAEFMPLFKAKFKNYLENCSLCRLSVIYGGNCQSCKIKFHTYCLAKVMEYNAKAKCINCKGLLNTPGSTVESSMDDENHLGPSTSRRSARRVRT